MANGIDYDDVEKALKYIGKQMPSLYKYVGYSRQSSKGYEDNGYIPIKHSEKIAKFFDIKLEDVIRSNIYNSVVSKDSKKCNLDTAVNVEIMSIKASAGGGNELIGISEYSTGEKAVIDNRFFKVKPNYDVKCIQVDGYSMIPMLFPDSWVIYRDTNTFENDGLYIINYDDTLMVKMLQINPELNKLDIISVNKEYRSYSIDKDDQTIFRIVGKVLRSII